MRLGKGGEGEAVYIFRSRLVCLVEISSVCVHFKIFIAVSVTKSCMVKITMRPDLISGCTLFGDVSPCLITLLYSRTLVDDL